MSQEAKLTAAKETFKTLCSALDHDDVQYDRFEDDLICRIVFTGNGLPITVFFHVDSKSDIVVLTSILPFKVSKEKYTDFFVAMNLLNEKLKGGRYSLDVFDGQVSYSITSDYTDTILSEGVFRSMLGWIMNADTQYTEDLFALNRGYLSLEDFQERLFK